MPENNDDKFLAMQLESVNTRLGEFAELFNKLFETVNEMRVVLERNTVTVEQHHRRSTTLEKLQISLQKRLEQSEKTLASLKDVFVHMNTEVAGIAADLVPIKSHVSRVSSAINCFTGFFTGIPQFLKLISLIFGVVIGAYGVYSIVHDVFGHFVK